MAPMTRARAPEGVANADTATYYAQRASAGLIVSEGIPISQEATGYLYLPGLTSAEQVAGWSQVTAAVHRHEGRIFAQLWHVGRMSHTSLQPGGAPPVSASAVPVPDGTMIFARSSEGTARLLPASAPRALATDEVSRVADDFAAAATRALDAGFDGVEVHAANGYLFEQFLNPHVNQRTDRYGGSPVNRARFLLEVVDRLVEVSDPRRIGIRLSPFAALGGLPPFPEAGELYLHLAEELAARGVGYLHLHDVRQDGEPVIPAWFGAELRARFTGAIVMNGGLTGASAERLLACGLVDLVAFGRPFIANPDLVERLQNGWPLAEVDYTRLYGGDASGYLDYPRYASVAPAECEQVKHGS